MWKLPKPINPAYLVAALFAAAFTVVAAFAQNPPAPVVASSQNYGQQSNGAISPATGVTADLASIIVPAGTYDIQCVYSASGASSPSVTDFIVTINTVAATLNVNPGQVSRAIRGTTATDPFVGGGTPLWRVTQTAPVTWFCNVFTAYTVGTWSPQGIISYRRAAQ